MILFTIFLVTEKVRLNFYQQEALVEACENQPFLLTRTFTTVNGYELYQNRWTELTETLNAVGLSKDVAKWQWVNIY